MPRKNSAPITDVASFDLDSVSTGVALADHNGCMIWANAAFKLRINTATLPASLLGIPFADIASAGLISSALRDSGESAVTITLVDQRVVTLYIGALNDDHRLICAATGWPRLTRTNAELTAQLDPLTGFGNRLLYDRRIKELAERSGQTQLGVLVIDLDHFKRVNDTLGHPAGDELLTLVAQRIRKSTRGDDTLVRLGGDEFAIITTAVARTERVAALGQRLVSLIARPFLVDGQQLDIGASIGIALLGKHSDQPADLLRHADLALYAAKNQGRNRYLFFDPEMERVAVQRRAYELDLRRALALRQFTLFYQPQTSFVDGRVTGFEALIRWHHPVRGQISPAEFIPLAEQLGEIVSIGAWVIRSACEQAMQWHDKTLTVAVNISPAQFESDAIVATIADTLAHTGLAPERLEVEITEGLLLAESPDVVERLWAIRNLGVAIALDDFGTGYASLSYLNSFPFSRIKIDKSFIQAEDSPRSRALVASILSMGANLGMSTIAEGIETSGQYDGIARAGCISAQGYYIARPMAAESIAAFLDAHAANATEKESS